MKKIILGMLVVFILSCNVEYNNRTEDPARTGAMKMAQEEVKNISEGGRTKWNSSSVVTDAFPVYLDGIEGISYYECKVMTGGKDSGYVLVNINNTDFPIVEATEEGLTTNETFEAITTKSKKEFVVYRYNYTASAAYEKSATPTTLLSRGAAIRPIATIGFENLEDFDFARYRSEVKRVGGSLYSTKTDKTEEVAIPYGMTGKGNANVYLRTCWNIANSTASTPPWNQFKIDYVGGGNAAVGCGAIAHAMNLAYWQVKKGKSNLFNVNSYTYDSYDTGLMKSEIIQIAIDIKTTKAADMGYTAPFDMVRIKEYIVRKGYSCSAERKNGTHDPKFNMIYDMIAEDRPVIMLIHATGIGAANHYVVIEQATRQSVVGNSYIRYYCNMGWGWSAGFYDAKYKRPTTNKWVYAFTQKPAEETAGGYSATRQSTYDFWDINIW